MAKKPTPQRGRGRPKADAPVIGREELDRMSKLWLRGWGYSAIANELGCHRTTVRQHIRGTIEPTWGAEQSLSRGADLQRVMALERLAWSKLEAGDTGSLDELRKAVGRSKKRSALLEALIERAGNRNDANVWLTTIDQIGRWPNSAHSGG